MERMSLRLWILGCLMAGLPSLGNAQLGSPAGPVPVDRLTARRQALLDRIRPGVAVIRSMDERSDDPPDSDHPQDSDYREDSDFFYLTGLEVPESWLVLVAPEQGPGEVILYMPPRDPAQERWTGPKLGPDSVTAALVGLPASAVRSVDRVERELGRLTTGGDGGPKSGAFFFKRDRRHLGLDLIRRLAAAQPSLEARNLLPLLAALRQVKDADEIERVRRAAELSAAGHLAVMRFAKPGMYEYELEAVAEMTFRKLGAERLAYPSIVGSGINGTTLHYDTNRRKTEPGDLVVMDMAGEFGYYAADVTRTIPISGQFTERQRAIYDLVLGAQTAMMDSIRPGMTLARLDRISRDYIKSHSNGLCGADTCDKYYIHGCCHHIGMDVHDVNTGAALVPGMTFTVEPGIYLPAEKLGVRIEDDVLVTERGYEILSKGAPRTADEVERAMR